MNFDGNWPELVAQVPVGGMARELLRQSELLGVDGARFALRVPVKPLTDPQLVARAAEALGQWFGRSIRLEVTLGDTRGADTAALRASEQRRQREADAVESIESDPFVRELISGFDATIVPNSIKPTEGESR